MKQTLKILTLLAAMLTLAGCDPDEMFNTKRDITYTVTTVGTQRAASAVDKTTTVHLETEAEWQALLDRFCDWAEGGSTVTFHRVGTQRAASASGKGIARTGHALSLQAKDAVEYSTTSREEMKRWMAQMEDEGMTVTVTYDPVTGTWNGTAYATAPSTNAGCITYATPWGVDGTGVVMTFDTVNQIVYITTGTAPDQMAVHFPTGKYSYSHSGDRLLLHYYYSIAAVLEESLTITPAGGDTLDLTYNYQGDCYTDHTHRAQLVPTTLYTTLHCYNEAADITLHIDRTNNTIGFGQTAVVYNDESMYTNTDRPFSQGWFSYSFMDIGDNGLLLGLLFYENLGTPNTLFDIEYLGSNHEVWHRYSELGTTEAYNPLRDFGFDRIN